MSASALISLLPLLTSFMSAGGQKQEGPESFSPAAYEMMDDFGYQVHPGTEMRFHLFFNAF